MANEVYGTCRICGQYGKLSREHFPPKGAFNHGDFKLTSINEYKTAKSLVWHQKWRSGGNARYRTCVNCNNNTGAWYARDYIDFANACEPYARPKFAGIIGHIPMIAFYPLRVVKQAVCSILVSSQLETELGSLSTVCAPSRALLGPPPNALIDLSAVSPVLPALRKFVLDPHAKGLPEGVKLYLYLVASLIGRSSGFAVMGREDTGTFAVFSELAWFPLGWALLVDGIVEEPIRDVTWWAQYDYDYQWFSDDLGVSCQWAVGNPLEFRSPDEIEETRIKNLDFIRSLGRAQ